MCMQSEPGGKQAGLRRLLTELYEDSGDEGVVWVELCCPGNFTARDGVRLTRC